MASLLRLQIIIFAVLATVPLLAEDSDRPQVLIIGDITYNEPSRKAAEILRFRADVSYTKLSSYDSSTALQNLDSLLENKKWDLIHFNFGFNDMMYKDPATQSIRAMHRDVGGVRVCPPTQYEKNLQELVERFKATGAKVVWAHTTPIVGSNGILYQGDEVQYNQIAETVMRKNNIPINDMYAYGLKSHQSIPRKLGNTFSYKGGKPLHAPVVKSILKELDLFQPVKGPVKVFLFVGDNTILGQGQIADTRKPRAGRPGTLDELVLNPTNADQFKQLASADGWSNRSDVWVQTYQRNSGNLSIGYGERTNMIGPELGFGHLIGDLFDEQTLIFKPNLRSTLCAPNFFTPKSGSYPNLLMQLNDSLENLQDTFPDCSPETRYEIAGIVLGYGINENDPEQFSKHLHILIDRLRQDLKTPNLPVVVVGTGIGGTDASSQYGPIIKKQMAVEKSIANVRFVDTQVFWPDKTKSPDNSPERWHGNAESFYNIGKSIGETMRKLLEARPTSKNKPTGIRN